MGCQREEGPGKGGWKGRTRGGKQTQSETERSQEQERKAVSQTAMGPEPLSRRSWSRHVTAGQVTRVGPEAQTE